MKPVIMSGSIVNELADLQKRKAVIAGDPRFSTEGKAQEIQKLDAQRNASAPKALTTFKGDWTEMRRAYSELKAEREQIAEAVAKQWDFQRLNYERTTATGIVSAARNPQDVQDAYEGVKLGGDRHAMRAFAETAASMLGGVKAFSDAGAMSAVRKSMQTEAAKLTASPEMQTQREAEAELSGEIARLYERTQQAANEFYPSSRTLGIGSNPFLDLLTGVQINKRVDPETLAQETSVDVNWD